MLALVLTLTLQAVSPGDSIDEFIDREMPRSGAPGLAYAVVVDGKVTEAGARGVVRQGEDEAVTLDTPFPIGSISKSITALAVMQLVEAGKVDLDAGLSSYLPGLSNSQAGAVTIRQLLSHTSGFSTFQGNSSHFDEREQADALSLRVAELLQEGPSHAPGESWEYSNVNYQVLGRVVEQVSEQPFEDYVEANIFEPIGMDHSFVADGETHDGMVAGHRPWFGTKQPLVLDATHRVMAPAGGVVSSASDLAAYMQVMLNERDDVLSAAGKDVMLRPASEASPFYGLGWFVDTENGNVWHDGSTPGVETLASMVPADDKGVIVLVNAGSGTGFGETIELRSGIAARSLDLDYAGEGSRWSQKLLFLGLTIAPFAFVFSLAWAWRGRDEIRAKRTSGFGLFSLWFPVFTTTVGAWAMLWLLPKLFGVPLATLGAFQPDLALVLIAFSITGVMWAVFRLGMAYTGTRRPASSPSA